MSEKKEGAYGGLSTTTGKERKTWDKEEYAQRAKEKDAEYRERAKERAEALKSGKCRRKQLYQIRSPIFIQLHKTNTTVQLYSHQARKYGGVKNCQKLRSCWRREKSL